MSSSTPKPGRVAGKYELKRLLGQGGMGAVFEARNLITGKDVAIKWMHAEVAANPIAAQRFLREAQACSRIRHPNVVDVYDVLNVDGSICLVMELLEGETLTAMMKRSSTTLPQLITVLIGAMRGVAAAHRAGIIHRDIKPDNIFLAREGDDDRIVPKMLDFGISKVSDVGDVTLTQSGGTMGTPMYMSIEQLRDARDIDARADVYALGVILYQAVTGQLPFEADSFPILIAKIMSEQAIAPKALRPDVPTSLSQLIEWAMAKDRAHRVPSVDAFIAALEPFATESGMRNQMTANAATSNEMQALVAATPLPPPPESLPPKISTPPAFAQTLPLSSAGEVNTPAPTEVASKSHSWRSVLSPSARVRRAALGAGAALLAAIGAALWWWSSADEAPEQLRERPVATARPELPAPSAAPRVVAPADPPAVLAEPTAAPVERAAVAAQEPAEAATGAASSSAPSAGATPEPRATPQAAPAARPRASSAPPSLAHEPARSRASSAPPSLAREPAPAQRRRPRAGAIRREDL